MLIAFGLVQLYFTLTSQVPWPIFFGSSSDTSDPDEGAQTDDAGQDICLNVIV